MPRPRRSQWCQVSRGRKRVDEAPRLAVLRPAVLEAVEEFVRINQAAAAGRWDVA